MNYSEQDIELFDRYLSGALEPDALQAFEQRLKTDAAFAEAYRVHALLAAGIREQARLELKQHLKENATIEYWGGNMWPRSMRFAAAAALLIFSAVYLLIRFYVNPNRMEAPLAHTESIPEVREPVPAPSDTLFPQETPELAELSPPPAPPLPIESPEEDVAADEMVAEKFLRMDADQAAGKVAEAEYAVSPPVLSEVKLFDTLYPALVIQSTPVLSKAAAAENKTYDNYALSRKKSSKAPAAANNSRLSENNNKVEIDSSSRQKNNTTAFTKKLQVEYWSSPVHFKGYRYTGNELRLYSLNRDKVKLLYLDNRLYLLYEGTVYRLDPCSNACNYTPEPDPDIAETIRTHTP